MKFDIEEIEGVRTDVVFYSREVFETSTSLFVKKMKPREFYYAMGFRPLEVFSNLWDVVNPVSINDKTYII